MAPKRPRPPEFFDGDLVRFTGPARLVTRVGYPETWREACTRVGPEALLRAVNGVHESLFPTTEKTGAWIRRPTPEQYRLAAEIGHYAASLNGFGGSERTVHYREWPEPPKLLRVEGPCAQPQRSGRLAGKLIREGERLPGSPSYGIDDGESTSFHFTRTVRLLHVREVPERGVMLVGALSQVHIDLPDVFGLVEAMPFDLVVAAPDVEIVSRGMAWAWSRGGALKKGQPCWVLHEDYTWREDVWSDSVRAPASRKRPDYGAIDTKEGA